MSDCICGGRGYYDDPDEPREAYCTCAAAFRVRKRDEWQSVPERTVFVNPIAFATIYHADHAAIRRWTDDGIVRVETANDGQWSIASDPDCPLDYAWPESAPPEVAAVVRQGIDDARKAAP